MKRSLQSTVQICTGRSVRVESFPLLSYENVVLDSGQLDEQGRLILRVSLVNVRLDTASVFSTLLVPGGETKLRIHNAQPESLTGVNEKIRRDRDLTEQEKTLLLASNDSFVKWLTDSYTDWNSDEMYETWKKSANADNQYAPDFLTDLKADTALFRRKFPFYLDLLNGEVLHKLLHPIEYHLDEIEAD
jgi:hypothetical protein